MAFCVAVHSQEKIVFVAAQRDHQIQVPTLEIGVKSELLLLSCGVDASEESVFCRSCRVILLLLITAELIPFNTLLTIYPCISFMIVLSFL